jgi:uncharacterized membrane protein
MGAFGQALGLVFSKYGMQDYMHLRNTIRIIDGIAGFVILITVMGKWNFVRDALKNRKAMTGTVSGSFFGLFSGCHFPLFRAAYFNRNSLNINGNVPVFLIPASIVFFRHRITLLEMAGL